MGSSSSPVSVIDISLENSAICFFTTSWRLEVGIESFCIYVGGYEDIIFLVCKFFFEVSCELFL